MVCLRPQTATQFPWVFNVPDTYWDGASVVIKYIGEQEGGGQSERQEDRLHLPGCRLWPEPIPLLDSCQKQWL
jgi:branched-chain amino acid transport system substrate-binding protein